jgi:tetratricopeptide (TPR) repeat protein
MLDTAQRYWQDAIALLKKEGSNNEKLGECYLELATCGLTGQAREETIQLAVNTLKKPHQLADAMLLQAHTSETRGDFVQASVLFEAALELNVHSPEAKVGLERMKHMVNALGKKGKADQAVDRAGRFKIMGNGCFKQGNPRTAIKWYRKAQQLDPSDPSFALNIIQAFVKLKQNREAVSEADMVLSQEQGLCVGQQVRLEGLKTANYNGKEGAVVSKAGERWMVGIVLEEGASKKLKIKPENLSVIKRNLTQAQLCKVHLFLSACKCNPRLKCFPLLFSQLHFRRGGALAQLDQLAEAVASYKVALAIEPKNARVAEALSGLQERVAEDVDSDDDAVVLEAVLEEEQERAREFEAEQERLEREQQQPMSAVERMFVGAGGGGEVDPDAPAKAPLVVELGGRSGDAVAEKGTSAVGEGDKGEGANGEGDKGEGDEDHVLQPVYSVEKRRSDAGERILVRVAFDLAHRARAARAVDLHTTSEQLIVSSTRSPPSFSPLCIPLPSQVDCSSCTAKFSKREGTLTVSLMAEASGSKA